MPRATWERLPAGIAVCVSPEDAAACVTWARETGAPFAVRSGGHSYAGFSTSDGLVIDVKGMRAVTVNPAAGTVTVAGGANNADVGDALKPYGVYFPGGRCPTVGVSGLTLGGGWGLSCRHLGMTCDSLLTTEVVTANGEIVTASATENPDLFWAVRGAAGGNFGVHTSFTYKVVPTQDVTFFSLSWSGGGTAELIDAITRMQIEGPRELGLRLNVTSQSRMPLSQPAPFQIDLVGLYWGPPADVEELLVRSSAFRLRTHGLSSGGVSGPRVTPWPQAPRRERTGSRPDSFGDRCLPRASGRCWNGSAALPGVPSLAQESTTVMYVWGGKVNDLAPDANAFVHRNADFLYKCEVIWEPQDDPALIAANLEWLEGYHAAMQPYFSGGAYQNFPDRTQADWPHAYYGDNFSRLVEVKRTWDPDNLFRFAQSIPVNL